MDIFFVVVLLLLISAAIARDAPWVPTRKTDVERFVTAVPIKKGDVMYDLGCGDGRLVEAAAKKGATGRGVELSFVPFVFSVIRKLASPVRASMSFRFGDIWKTSVRDADLVYVWLMPKAMDRMKHKLETELKPGARVVTYIWPMPGWTATSVVQASGHGDIYVYQIPGPRDITGEGSSVRNAQKQQAPPR